MACSRPDLDSTRGSVLDDASRGAGRPRYADRESWPRFEQQAVEALRALPGVADAGITSVLPFSTSE